MNQFSETGAFNFVDKTAVIGTGSTVWHYAIVLANVVIGCNCNIGSHVEVGHGSRIGDHTRIGKGVFLPPNSLIGSYVFVAPGVYMADDKYPRCGNADYNARPPVIEDYAVIGMCAVLLPGVHVGRNAVIGAGAVVTKDVAEGQVVHGDAARVRNLPLGLQRAEHGWYN